MHKLPDSEIEKIIDGKLPWRPNVSVLFNEVQVFPEHGLVRIAAQSLRDALVEIDEARGLAGLLATEIKAWRSNSAVYAEAVDKSNPRCWNCLHWQQLQSAIATLPPKLQAIPKDPGACTLNPPAMIPKGAGEHLSTTSSFPPVHPFQVCSHHQPAPKAAE